MTPVWLTRPQILPRAHDCYPQFVKFTLYNTQFDPSSSPTFTYTLTSSSLCSFQFTSTPNQCQVFIVIIIRLNCSISTFSARLFSNFVVNLGFYSSLSHLFNLTQSCSVYPVVNPQAIFFYCPVYCSYSQYIKSFPIQGRLVSVQKCSLLSTRATAKSFCTLLRCYPVS